MVGALFARVGGPARGRGLLPLALATVAVVVLTASGVAGAQSAYDRTPVRISQLTPDQWGAAATTADSQVRARFPSAKSVYCVGVIMIGHSLSQSTFLHGTTRYWDKFFCRLTMSATSGMQMIYDPKGASSGTVYRVKPWKPAGAAAASNGSTGARPAGPKGSAGSGGASVGRIQAGQFFRIGSATMNSDRSVTVTWALPADTDEDDYLDLEWTLDGTTQLSYSSTNWKRTELRTRPLSPGTHQIAVTILDVFWTDHYYEDADCDVSSRDDYLFVCGYDDTSTVTVNTP